MLFNSLSFLIFFPVVTALYFLLPQRHRWLLLLLASCGFYMAFIPSYILILGATIVVDYWAGIAIAGATEGRRKLCLAASLVANVGVLFVFKYYNFFAVNATALSNALHWNYSVEALAMVLPIGLSFHTFQAMSYTIEVYRGAQKPEMHFGIYALYVMFYPQLVAGPIERPQNLLHQFHEHHSFNSARATAGLQLMLWGLFKKMLVADRLALLVNPVFAAPSDYHGLSVILAAAFFAVQIYCDFSGYSDVARGCAKVMGFELMVNFRNPYSARSIADFWRRWHISLSTWFRDYLYLPLGGNRVGWVKRCRNVLLVFVVSGLWHGANWTFLVWGAIHGLALCVSMLSSPLRTRFDGWSRAPWLSGLSWAYDVATTFALVTAAWVFFRADSIADAFTMLQNAFAAPLVTDAPGPFLQGKQGLLTGIALAVLVFVEAAAERPLWERAAGLRTVRWATYVAAAIALLNFGVPDEIPFIYFQF